MILEFTKMNGAGNDFVLFDNRAGQIRLTRDQIVRLCDRHRGVGADGIAALIPCTSGKAEWAWEFYNSDGSEAEMCGNGARCFARFVQRLTGAAEKMSFETRAGVINAVFRGERVMIGLTAPQDFRLNQLVPLSTGVTTVHSVNTGVPHAVLFVSDLEKAPVVSLGAEIRYHKHFAPRGTNVNFVQLLEGNLIRVRTYERGVEGETLACGTGVTASALVTAELHSCKSPIAVRVQGGDLMEVSFEKASTGVHKNVCLTGPADFAFQGSIQI